MNAEKQATWSYREACVVDITKYKTKRLATAKMGSWRRRSNIPVLFFYRSKEVMKRRELGG